MDFKKKFLSGKTVLSFIKTILILNKAKNKLFLMSTSIAIFDVEIFVKKVNILIED